MLLVLQHPIQHMITLTWYSITTNSNHFTQDHLYYGICHTPHHTTRGLLIHMCIGTFLITTWGKVVVSTMTGYWKLDLYNLNLAATNSVTIAIITVPTVIVTSMSTFCKLSA